MPRHPSRRDFLTWSLAAGAAPAVLGPAGEAAGAAIRPQPGADKLTAYPFGPQIWIRWADDPVTCYRAHPTQKYPYLYPLTGPVSGLSLTTESGSSYPHHRTLLFARDYGFISPTPMNFIDTSWTLAAGKSVTLRYRVLLFAGDPKEAQVERIYRAWAT